ncbi:gliding motility-associated C-terminal domain-containing protein [Cellulophaga sp. F20128]|uniref:Ig-like domain-containing protein n=1 Tax=Cellulophaga sp. F20128 TaxID=2926413 RepID=UPI001FF613B6|nr:gliding motility-associated C-terminal domain-containing protein [Cellulophaga sp. F20128]MCK0157150.1 gliding motility-associated C-terminal domain-containing protein [Cellulophaga sp. F20128]
MSKYLLQFKKVVFVVLPLFLSIATTINAQTKIYATSVTDEYQTDNASLAHDEDLTTNAAINASSGLVLGAGAYSGYLELQFPTVVPQNTTSYVKIETEDDLLPSLLGGSLGGLLSEIVGTLLIGNQEILVEAKNNAATILQRESNNTTHFGTDELRVVVNSNNDYFLAITPDVDYNRIRLQNRMGSLLGFFNTKTLGLYEAFYTNGTGGGCGLPNYTAYNGSGLTLDLLNLGGAGVTNPNFILDGNSSTFSELSLGILGVAAQIEQTVFYDNVSHADDNFYIRLAVDPSLLAVGLANNVEIIAQNGTQNIYSENLSNLLTLDLLGLLQGGGSAMIGFDPGASIDRVTVRLSSLLSVALSQEIKIFDIYKAPAQPVMTSPVGDINICAGSSVDLLAEADGASNVELRWYDALIGGNLLATVNSGTAYTTPILNSDATYYVSSAKIGCTEESPRVTVAVNVVDIPTAADITVIGNQDPICSITDAVLVPSSTIAGTFSWYFDAAGSSEITDGLVVGSVTYSIDGNGVLNITGLNETSGPYTYYVSISEDLAGCKNAPGDLKEVVLDVIDSSNAATVTLDSSITLANLISIFQGNPSTNVTGVVSGNVAPGDAITLSINGTTYNGALDSNLEFDITVDGIDLTTDIDNILEVFIDGGLCSITAEVIVDIPELEVDDLIQEFCASDAPTLADLVVDSDISFFGSLLGDVLLDINTPLVDGQVYFAGVEGILASILPRVAITVNLTDLLPPTTINISQTFCMGDVVTLADIQINESGAVFYDSLLSGLLLDITTPLVDGGVYFAANVGSGCESTTRLAITVSFIDTPPATTLNSTQSFCGEENAVVSDIQVNEPNVVFYDRATEGTMLDPSDALVDGGIYYVANVESGCESATRLAITANITETPSATTSNTTQTFCESEDPIIADIQINESDVVFYDSETGGTMLDPSAALVDGGIYYVANVASGCESSTRQIINVIVTAEETVTIIGEFDEVCISERTYTYETESNKLNYVWTIVGGSITEGGTSTDNSVTVTWNELQDTTIKVSYDSDFGCSSEIETVDVSTMSCGVVLGEEFCLFVFNEFTPNNDGYNDFFEVNCIETYASTLQVFNRNGNLVYKTVNYQNNWNGIANVNGVLKKGDHLPSGTYYYIINIPELNRNLTGWIQLAR